MTLLDNGSTEKRAGAARQPQTQRRHAPLEAKPTKGSKIGAALTAKFIAYKRLNSFQAIGLLLKRAKTVSPALRG